MTSAQWRGIARRTPVYLEAYTDHPGSQDKAQRRAEWLAELPVFENSKSVLEVGCGCGRNLAAIKRRHPNMVLSGLDINQEALAVAKEMLPAGQFIEIDLHVFSQDKRFPTRSVVLAVGVLTHIHPKVIPSVLKALWTSAGEILVIVDEVGRGEVLKGPRAWKPTVKVTGDYIAWAHPLYDLLIQAAAVKPQQITILQALPEDLQTIGARWLIVARR